MNNYLQVLLIMYQLYMHIHLVIIKAQNKIRHIRKKLPWLHFGGLSCSLESAFLSQPLHSNSGMQI